MKFGKQFWIESLGKKWALNLKEILKSPYAEKLMKFIEKEYAIHCTLNSVKPSKDDIFKAFKLCPWDSVRIVILGHKPHSNVFGANGLAFGDSCSSTFSSPNLCRIMDCIEREYYDGFNLDFDHTLESWAKQGVLLLNRQLTVKETDNGTHTKPWGKFISAVLNVLNEYKPGTIYILWGKENQKLAPYLEKNNHILKFDHPEDYYKDWHCPNFKEADKLLMDLHGETIKW